MIRVKVANEKQQTLLDHSPAGRSSSRPQAYRCPPCH